MAPRTQSSEMEVGDSEPSFDFLTNELRELARILERDLEELNRLPRATGLRALANTRWMAFTIAASAFFFGAAYAIVQESIESSIMVGLLIIAIVAGVFASLEGVTGLGDAVRVMKRRENLVRYLRLKIRVGEEILDRAAVWLDRGKMPRAEKTILQLYFTHAQQLLDEARVVADA